MKRSLQNILITGGAGFIGSNFIRFLFNEAGFTGRVVNLDKLTYAGNPLNLQDIAENQHYTFVKGDICDAAAVEQVFSQYKIDTVVHFAAESHVDRSIHGPMAFVHTNVIGTATLLEAARAAWQERSDVLFHHVSTDEVYGSLGSEGAFLEETPYDPRSPYSASKASSDHFVSSFHHTFGLPITISNCSNNYGPYQFPEKLIPLMIRNLQQGKSLPVYGDGKNIRDWLYVEDHNRAVWQIMQSGRNGETYNIGGENEWENLTLVRQLCKAMANITGNPENQYLDLITFVKDRPGHDKRYAIDCNKIKSELSWNQTVDFSEGLEKTIKWYLDNQDWVEQVESGEYRKWIESNYGSR
ncbi:MAG: dTDP-glucose 4,6-dehydratase [Spirochaetaceae bacterium]|nr:dTDP-glucose 4,6-dehydratase [Spirochaetaceae bacterium]MCF7938745.1 dTDP-glucose 4,6-dehydratase [Spirochaetales bacterium]